MRQGRAAEMRLDGHPSLRVLGGVGELHLADAPPAQRNDALDSTIIAVQEGICS